MKTLENNFSCPEHTAQKLKSSTNTKNIRTPFFEGSFIGKQSESTNSKETIFLNCLQKPTQNQSVQQPPKIK